MWKRVRSSAVGDRSWPAIKIGRVTDVLKGCPTLGGVAPSNTVYTEDPMACVYDGNAVAKDAVALKAYTKEQREQRGDLNWYENDMMNVMCAQPADPASCPSVSAGYKDSHGNPLCCNMVASDLCKSWSRTAVGKAPADDIMRGWCASHVDASRPFDDTKSDPTCKCINRQLDKSFNELQRQTMADASCWFKPCYDQEMREYLVPSQTRERQCDSDVCVQLINVEDSGKTDLSGIVQYLSCSPTDGSGKNGGAAKIVAITACALLLGAAAALLLIKRRKGAP